MAVIECLDRPYQLPLFVDPLRISPPDLTGIELDTLAARLRILPARSRVFLPLVAGRDPNEAIIEGVTSGKSGTYVLYDDDLATERTAGPKYITSIGGVLVRISDPHEVDRLRALLLERDIGLPESLLGQAIDVGNRLTLSAASSLQNGVEIPILRVDPGAIMVAHRDRLLPSDSNDLQRLIGGI